VRAIAAIPALGLLTGAGFALLVPDLPLLVPLLALVVATLGVLVARQRSCSTLAAILIGLAFCAGGVALGVDAWSKAWHTSLRGELAGGDAVVLLTGVLRGDASVRASGVSLLVDPRSICKADAGRPAGECAEVPVSGGVALTVLGALALEHVHAWRAGRVIRVPTALRRPPRYMNPGAPDEERALARRGISLVGIVKSGALVELVAHGHWFAEAGGVVRAAVRRAVHAGVGRWSPASAAIVTAILIGDRTGLDDEVERRLQEAGTYHVIAISGGNIAILAGLTLIVFRVAGVLGRAAMVVASVALVLYWACVGGGASVTRASLMALVYLAERAIDLCFSYAF
jgi:competence protein ComEC